MKIYIARQPIYNRNKSLYGYELLYRNSNQNYYPNVNQDDATRELTYNVLSEFDFNTLINHKYGFINFTRESLMSDMPLLFKPDSIIIEILENITLDQVLIEKIKFFKNKGYILALDDFIDDGTYNDILPYIDIIKVEYNLLDSNLRKDIASKYRYSKKLIAERIETEEEYKNAIDEGYDFFQGYYFSKPIMISKNSINIASSTYLRLIKEMSKEDPNFNSLENIIKLDAGLTYKLLSLMNTPVYYTGKEIKSIKQALLQLGTREIKRWIMLLFLRDISNLDNDEFAKVSLTRAIFMEKLIIKLGHRSMSQDAYILGLLSLIDNTYEEDILSVLEVLELSEDVKIALIKQKGILYEILECIKGYENRDWDKVNEFSKIYNLEKDIIPLFYLESLKYADDMFKDK